MIGRDEAYERIMSIGKTLKASWSKKWIRTSQLWETWLKCFYTGAAAQKIGFL